MNLRKNSGYYFLVAALFVMLPFQNCSPQFKVNSIESGEIALGSVGDQNTGNTDTDNDDTTPINPPVVVNPPPVNKDLITAANLKYKGAFRVSVQNDDLGVSYSYGQMTFNPDKKSLFIVGHDYSQAIGEFVIPQLSTSTNIAQLPRVVIQGNQLKEVIDAPGVNNTDGINRITGLLYRNNQLIVNAETWYDGGGTNTQTTLVVKDAKNLVNSEVYGFYKMADGARAAGYMSEVPPEWQQKIGSSYVTGWSTGYSIISRYSIGPSIYSVDVDAVLRMTTRTGSIPTKAIMSFPYGGGEFLSPTAIELNTNRQPASAVYNALSRAVYGMIIPGTSTFIAFGSTEGLVGGLGYKITQDTGETCGGPCPYLANDSYNYYWLFDMNEIINAPRVSAPRPYAYGKLSIPFDQNGRYKIGGGAYDSQSGSIYLSLIGADTLEGSRTPLIVSFGVEK